MSEMENTERDCGMVDRGSGDAPSQAATPESCNPTPESSSNEFSRETFLGLLRTGLRPSTALAYLGVRPDRWQEIREADPTLRKEMGKAVATFEMIHVRNLHARIQETSDWRGIAWWLAQRFPSRYGGGRQGKEIEKAVENIVEAIDDSLRAEFRSPGELERLGNVFARLGRD
jgi:hypothetical protein